jgi:phospholipid/cholesterol/gamma-HCH transport system substrate-binding protein
MNDDRRNYVVVGACVVLVVVLFVGWIAMISGRSGATDAYHAIYQKVPGLKVGSHVLFQGHRIGYIDRIDYDATARQFRLALELERDWQVPEDSIASIKASGLLSAVVIDIRGGESARNLSPGSEVRTEESADLFAALSSVASQLGGMMDEDLQPLLASIRDDVPEVMDSLQQFMDQANETVRRINRVLREENADRLDRIVINAEESSRQVSSLMGGMRETRAELHEAIVAVNDVVQARQGDLDQSLADLQRSLEAVALHIDAITASLESASRDMAAFSNQIRRDPSVVLRGRARADDAPESR